MRKFFMIFKEFSLKQKKFFERYESDLNPEFSYLGLC